MTQMLIVSCRRSAAAWLLLCCSVCCFLPSNCVVDPPKSLDVVSTHNTIYISWDASSTANVKYLVKCGDRTGHTNRTNSYFYHLQPESEYDVSVTAYLPSSSPIVYSDSLVGIGRTSLMPVDYNTVKVTALNDTSLLFTWQRPKGTSATHFAFSCGWNGLLVTDTTAVCEGLTPNRRYSVRINTLHANDTFEPNFSPLARYVIANASVTQPMGTGISAYNITNNSLLVTWYPSPTPNAQYEVQCSANNTIRTSETRAVCCCYNIESITANVASFIFTHLKVDYNVSVRAIGSSLLPTEWYTQVFYQAVKPIGERLKSVQAGSDWLSLSWFPRNDSSSDRELYTIFYYASAPAASFLIDKSNITLTGLKPNTTYDIFIEDRIALIDFIDSNSLTMYLQYRTLAAE